MNTYISLLRGINVNGKNLIKMSVLQKLYESIGLLNIKIYIQSGNVIFQTEEGNTSILENKISLALLQSLSLEVPVIVKEKSELKSIFDNNLYLNKANENNENQYICFLSTRVDVKLLEKIDRFKYLPDTFELMSDVIFLFCPNGYGNSKLNNNFFEKKLKVNATTRNLKTLITLINISENM